MHQNCHEHFRKHAPKFCHEPSQHRYCADKCCCLIFILATILFVSLGIYYIISANYPELKELESAEYSPKILQHFKLEVIGQMIYFSWITVGASLIAGFLLSVMLYKAPKFSLYVFVWLGSIGFLLLIFLLFAYNLIALGVLLTIIFLVFLIFVACTKQKISEGAVILKITSSILKHKPKIFLMPIFVLIFFACLFEVFWFYSFFGIAAHHGSWENKEQLIRQQGVNTAVQVLWVFFHFFYGFILYNCAVYLVGNVCSSSFYRDKSSSVCKGVCQIFCNHLGSFTFAYFLSVPVALLRQTAECDQRGNVRGCGIYACLLSCCLKFVEGTFQVINHNSILMMGISGENYINSARTALSLVSYNLKVFFLIDFISTLISLAGMTLLSAFSGIIAFLLYQNASEMDPSQNIYFPIGIIAVMLISSTIASIIFTSVSETLNCIYILYCLQKRFQQNQMNYSDPQEELQQIFQKLQPLIETSDRQRNNQKQIQGLIIKTLQGEIKKKAQKK